MWKLVKGSPAIFNLSSLSQTVARNEFNQKPLVNITQ